ncbi:MAG: disulfide oxidoreductase [Methanoculleus sp. SDB]|nr:MAG: disulfide oxidoreductase [Methanoculleus sp. SDB]
MVLSADSMIMDVLREKPEAADIFFRFGMGCLGCAMAKGETIREAAQAHAIPLAELLNALGISE